MAVKHRDRMFRSSSSCTELFWQSQSDTSSARQLRISKATIAVAASLILLLMLFVSMSVALHRRRRGQPECESLHLAIARLFAANQYR
ncbi:hypothetical protein MRX96_025882 [Rhipicephalus microplus]